MVNKGRDRQIKRAIRKMCRQEFTSKDIAELARVPRGTVSLRLSRMAADGKLKYRMKGTHFRYYRTKTYDKYPHPKTPEGRAREPSYPGRIGPLLPRVIVNLQEQVEELAKSARQRISFSLDLTDDEFKEVLYYLATHGITISGG